jgi:hypothetical protein
VAALFTAEHQREVQQVVQRVAQACMFHPLLQVGVRGDLCELLQGGSSTSA